MFQKMHLTQAENMGLTGLISDATFVYYFHHKRGISHKFKTFNDRSLTKFINSEYIHNSNFQYANEVFLYACLIKKIMSIYL